MENTKLSGWPQTFERSCILFCITTTFILILSFLLKISPTYFLWHLSSRLPAGYYFATRIQIWPRDDDDDDDDDDDEEEGEETQCALSRVSRAGRHTPQYNESSD